MTAGLAGEAGGVHGRIALDDDVERKPRVEIPLQGIQMRPQLLVGRAQVEVVVLEGMDRLVHEGLTLARGEVPKLHALGLGDDPQGPGPEASRNQECVP